MIREIHLLSTHEARNGLYRTRELHFESRAAARLSERQVHLSAQSAVFEERRSLSCRSQIEESILQEHVRQLNDPRYQMMMRLAESFEEARRWKKERPLWYYRRTTGIKSSDAIRKAINRQIEDKFTNRFGIGSIADRVRHILNARYNSDDIVKIHSPPIRLFPKTLHPVDSVA